MMEELLTRIILAVVFALPVVFMLAAFLMRPRFRPYERLRDRQRRLARPLASLPRRRFPLSCLSG